jgi:hypothetical protein
MYTKQYAAKQRELFWTAFGKYMRPLLSADGEQINWVNYKTGVPGIHFKMDVVEDQAVIAMVFSHTNLTHQGEQFGLLLQLRGMLQEELGEEWLWQTGITDAYGKQISTVSKALQNVNIFRNEDWPALISFFKPRIMALDAFWSVAKAGFEGME